MPVLLWAIIFVILVGLGPLAGTLGIAAYTVGYLAKIYADLFEGTDPEIIEAVQSTGASKLQLVRFVIRPARPPMRFSPKCCSCSNTTSAPPRCLASSAPAA